MKIIIVGVEPQFKVYKMSESIENKFYIGMTKTPLKDRMNGHRHGNHGLKSADTHFSNLEFTVGLATFLASSPTLPQ